MSWHSFRSVSGGVSRLMNKDIKVFLAAFLALSGCGRNPGALPRTYPFPGIAEIEAQIARLQPKCMAADFSGLKASTVSIGKKHFISEEGGRFKLVSYVVSQVIDRADRFVLSTVFRMSEFQATEIRIEAPCLDLKGEALELAISPVSEIDAQKGFALKQQPFQLAASAKGELSLKSLRTREASSPFDLAKVPEVAILLGTDYVSKFKTLKFTVDGSDAKRVNVVGEFIGIDESFSRKLVRVEATYGWEVSPGI